MSVVCPLMLRFDDIGNRLKAFRLGSGRSAEEIAQKLGISRTALYRFEKGEVAKIETLEKLAELLDVSVPTLLGVGVEYIASAVSYFERMRQIEETAEHIIVLAGPISYVLASDGFDRALGDVLRELVPEGIAKRERALKQIDELMDVLRQRKESYRRRRPAIVNLIAAAEMERFMRNGLVGRLDLPEKIRRERRALARAEAEHFTALMDNEPIGVQIGIVRDTLPHTSFQIFRQPDRKILALSPFRLGEEPNIRTGVAMITSAPEALALHETMARELWASALKGPAAVRFMRGMMEKLYPPPRKRGRGTARSAVEGASALPQALQSVLAGLVPGIMPAGITTGARGAHWTGKAKAERPLRPAQEAWPGCALGDVSPLGESRGGTPAGERARERKGRRKPQLRGATRTRLVREVLTCVCRRSASLISLVACSPG